MSDEKLSFDETQANLQVSLTDTNRRQRTAFTWAGVNAALGQTDFEGYQLNTMLDMIESAKPSDLEAAADALANASDAIEGVGEDIKKYAANVDWEGESGEAFRTWADNLGKNTLKLATYTGQAGVQMRAASIGLASVKSGMPPREQGPYLPMDIDKANAAEDPREKNRQEAITQMNRLSSFYTVSRDTMAAQEEPTFAPPPNVGVPIPDGDRAPEAGSPPGPDHPTGSERWGANGAAIAANDPELANISYSTQPVGMEINTASSHQTNPVERTSLRPGLTTSSSPSVPNGYALVPPTAGTSPTPQQRTGRGPYGGSPQKQAIAPHQTNSWRQPDARTSGTPPVGGRLPGPAASNPTPVGRAPHSAFPARPGRPDAVFGGMPYRPGVAGSPPIPQGRVIGAETGTSSRTPMVGHSGAAGPHGNTGSVGPDHRRANGHRSVEGASRPVPASRMQSGGFFTPGGMGLVNPRGTVRAESHEERRVNSRPEYLAEDEKTWKYRRDIVPPVVE
ncbi:hypothetical protein [Streptomyces sp. GSL17-111]|uniref:hypothetical protein n=1 Tax=Streptomyces sp. GSL17-111 TaxID=3121596 RepID=UPI0030F47EB4